VKNSASGEIVQETTEETQSLKPSSTSSRTTEYETPSIDRWRSHTNEQLPQTTPPASSGEPARLRINSSMDEAVLSRADAVIEMFSQIAASNNEHHSQIPTSSVPSVGQPRFFGIKRKPLTDMTQSAMNKANEVVSVSLAATDHTSRTGGSIQPTSSILSTGFTPINAQPCLTMAVVVDGKAKVIHYGDVPASSTLVNVPNHSIADNFSQRQFDDEDAHSSCLKETI